MPTKELNQKLDTYIKYRKNYNKQERKLIFKSLISEILDELGKNKYE